MKKMVVVAAFCALLSLGGFSETVVGNGTIRTELRQLPRFSALDLAGTANIHVHRGPQRLQLSMDSNLLPLFVTEVSGSRLKLHFRSGVTISGLTRLDIDISLPELDGVDLSGEARAVIDEFSGASFESSISGAAELAAVLNYKDMKLGLSGAGAMTLSGNSGTVTMSIDGAGRISARSLRVEGLALQVRGSGYAEVRARDSLTVQVDGMASISYWGNPRLTQRVSGSGSVTRVGD
ncbi:MAG TPA: head GIN domain-containing protein [Rectinemataceae bacterium]|nr:head GIN domain-containing protein [Rectinemataceae bacterium]